MNDDKHQKAMRDAAKAPDFEYDGLDGMFHPTLTTMECNGLLNLIREQVRRMDEVCVWTYKDGDDGRAWYSNCGNVYYNTTCSSGEYCRQCGKRIKVGGKQ